MASWSVESLPLKERLMVKDKACNSSTDSTVAPSERPLHSHWLSLTYALLRATLLDILLLPDATVLAWGSSASWESYFWDHIPFLSLLLPATVINISQKSFKLAPLCSLLQNLILHLHCGSPPPPVLSFLALTPWGTFSLSKFWMTYTIRSNLLRPPIYCQISSRQQKRF